MAKFSFYLDSRANKVSAPIKVRLYGKGKVMFVDTGLRAAPDNWNVRKRRLYQGDFENRWLDHSEERIREVIMELPDRFAGTEKQLDMLRMKLSVMLTGNRPAPSRSRRFLARFESFKNAKQTTGTRIVYERTIIALSNFDDKLEYRGFEDIDLDYLRRFESWCSQTMKINTISLHMRNIRAVFNDAIADDVTDCYPFRKYKIKQEKTKKRSLNLEQFTKLIHEDVETFQIEYRDMFLLSFYLIGVNPTDLFHAKKDQLQDGRFFYTRQKTGTEYSIKVEPEAMAIINKYKGKDYLLSPLDRYDDIKNYIQHMNRALKGIGRDTGKRGKVMSTGYFPDISSYWARHTWATFAYECGFNIDIIAQALGHQARGREVTMTYIRLNPAKVDDANRKVIDYALGKLKKTEEQKPMQKSIDIDKLMAFLATQG